MLPFTIPSKMQKPWENASFTVMHQSWENCAIVTQALDKRKLRMTNWKALIQFKLLQHLAYTEVKKVLQHFITLLNDEKVLILRAKHNLLIDWYTRSRLEKKPIYHTCSYCLNVQLILKNIVISTTSSLCKKSGNYFVSKSLIFT